ncbi:Mfs phs inorganic phosphate transporter [Coniochaeta hoffmannii]|uniref:Mfs phs inorganic phosphate transporter n=1 Tax=Coniochaeta hoffmannii TaxID=91930 RepID=A0AA38VQN5_9PEZI|nr:Mfs phs inorganic phosphate transporter [Coniochaeta hoffmannii]
MASSPGSGDDTAYRTDQNERRRLALAEIDKAPFGWYHVRAVVVAGVGFFTDAYDLFSINMITGLLGIVYFQQAVTNPGTLPSTADTGLKVATSAGTVIGQLTFGWLADVVGRKRMYGFELIIIIVSTLAQTMTGTSVAVGVIGALVFWRVIMGIGIGGDYPLSAIITSEFATTKWRGAMMGSVFAMQGIGQLVAALVALIATAGFKESLIGSPAVGKCDAECLLAVDRMWRIIVGFGAVPGCVALYFRLTIPETPRYTFDIARDVEQAAADAKAYLGGKNGGQADELQRVQAVQQATELEVPKASWADFLAYYGKWKNAKVLIGTAGSWFFLDIAFYGLSLNNSVILSAIGYTGGSTVYQVLFNNAVGNIIIVCAGTVPGYWFTVALCDVWGRKPIQIMGFVILIILFCILGFAYDKLGQSGIFALITLAQFFIQFGPNTTTFIVPGECFPTRYRSTSHGISAAAGKVGSIIAQVVFGPLRTIGAPATCSGAACSPWLNHVMQIFALFMLCGLGTTFLIPETARKTLEELTGEDWDGGVVTPRSDGVVEMLAGPGADEKAVLEAEGPESGR